MKSVKKVSAVLLAMLLSLSLIALVGCSSGSTTDDSAGSESSATESSATESSATGAATGATIDDTWTGMWFSKSEIVPPEEETDQYDIDIAEDGSFVLNDSGTELYTGTMEVTNEPEDNWGIATIDGEDETIQVQIVNAQGVYKLIFNAGDDWNKNIKKIIFMR